MSRERVGLTKELIPVRVKSIKDIARMAASIIALGQMAYIVRASIGGKRILGIIAVFRDYYDLYGLPILYYYVDDKGEYSDNSYILVRVDESGEHIEASKSAKRGWIPIPVVDVAEWPKFFPESLKKEPLH